MWKMRLLAEAFEPVVGQSEMLRKLRELKAKRLEKTF